MNRRTALRRLGALSMVSPGLFSQERSSTDFLAHHDAFDLHCHPGMFPQRGAPQYGGDEAFHKTVADMRAGGLAAALFSLVADAKVLARNPSGQITQSRKFASGEAWSDCERQLKTLDELAAREDVGVATTVRQMEAFRKRRRLCAFVSCEGGDCLEGNVERLQDLYEHGVRSLQLVHYAQNNLGDSQTLPPVYNGLSAFGRDVVRHMNRLGMVVDVAHASFAAAKAAAEASSAPIILSHTHLQTESSPHPRLISTEHARLIAATGGVIGAWPSGFANRTFSDFVDQTMRLVDTVGVDHVGLGTDMDGNYKPVFSNYRQLPDWIAGLRAKGLSEADLAKVAGGNAVRVLRQVIDR